MGVLLVRFAESRKPEGERIFYDPYAVYFINPDVLKWEARNPDEARALLEQYERFLPGVNNYLIARTILCDDFVKKSIDEGLQQLVIFGAGYDSRAYRIDGLKKIKVFELDHPATQTVKKEKIKKIFGGLPDHVVYVPMDLEKGNLGQGLLERGYDWSKKTLFLLEGVLAYLQSKSVDEIFSFIAKNSCKGSSVVFSYPSQSAVDVSDETEVDKNMLTLVSQLGEPSRFSITEGAIKTFLSQRGFRLVCNVTGEDIKKAYFRGLNKNRPVWNQGYTAYAVIE